MVTYETKWEVVREALIVLRRLQEGPADRDTLIQAVRSELPTSFRQPTADAERRHFERVLEALRYRLYVDVPWNRSIRMYCLREAGPYFQQTLTPDQLKGLAFLLESFAETNERFQRVVRPFLEQIRDRLTPEQRRILERQYSIFQWVELSTSGEDHVDPSVWQTAQSAVGQHRLTRFNYLNPRHQQDDGLPRTHTAEPYEIVFRDGHIYLQAFCREWRHPEGFSGGGKWHLYRLDYILPKSFEILPSVFSPDLRGKRLLTVRYKVAPQIGRGNMAQHFEEMTIVGPDEDDWIEVTGKTTSLFNAYRTLLRLGMYCVALDPPELVDMMRSAVKGMAKLYDKYHGSES